MPRLESIPFFYIIPTHVTSLVQFISVKKKKKSRPLILCKATHHFVTYQLCLHVRFSFSTCARHIFYLYTCNCHLHCLMYLAISSLVLLQHVPLCRLYMKGILCMPDQILCFHPGPLALQKAFDGVLKTLPAEFSTYILEFGVQSISQRL